MIYLLFLLIFNVLRFLTKETEAIDDFESHLGEATEKFERNRGKFERVARTGHRWAGWQWDGNVGFRASKDGTYLEI